MGTYGVHDPSRYRPFPSSKCIFFCFLSNKREERDYLLSLVVLLYVELLSVGTPPPTDPTHTNVDTTSLATRHTMPLFGRGAMGTYGVLVHDTSPPPLLIAPFFPIILIFSFLSFFQYFSYSNYLLVLEFPILFFRFSLFCHFSAFFPKLFHNKYLILFNFPSFSILIFLIIP